MVLLDFAGSRSSTCSDSRRAFPVRRYHIPTSLKHERRFAEVSPNFCIPSVSLVAGTLAFGETIFLDGEGAVSRSWAE